MGLLDGKVAIITGAARGIGVSITDVFTEEGAKVAINGRNAQNLEKFAAEIKQRDGDVYAIPGDMGDPEVPEEVVRKTIERFGRLDIVVSNAAILDRTPTLDMTLENWHSVMNINLTGPMLLARAALRRFKEQGSGKVIFISSIIAKTVNRNASPAYGCSKAATTYLMRHLAWEFGSYGITVNSILPGYIRSTMSSGMTPEFEEFQRKGILLGHVGEPRDIGYAALYLASKYGDYVTGECLDVNGGLHMD